VRACGQRRRGEGGRAGSAEPWPWRVSATPTRQKAWWREKWGELTSAARLGGEAQRGAAHAGFGDPHDDGSDDTGPSRGRECELVRRPVLPRDHLLV
jgi:hypothetical protein